MTDFQRIGPLADSFIESQCQYIYLFVLFHVIYFEAFHWPLDPGPPIIGPGTSIRATIRALPSAHYYLRYHPRYHPRATIYVLPCAHYHLLFNQMIVDTKA